MRPHTDSTTTTTIPATIPELEDGERLVTVAIAATDRLKCSVLSAARSCKTPNQVWVAEGMVGSNGRGGGTVSTALTVDLTTLSHSVRAIPTQPSAPDAIVV